MCMCMKVNANCLEEQRKLIDWKGREMRRWGRVCIHCITSTWTEVSSCNTVLCTVNILHEKIILGYLFIIVVTTVIPIQVKNKA